MEKTSTPKDPEDHFNSSEQMCAILAHVMKVRIFILVLPHHIGKENLSGKKKNA